MGKQLRWIAFLIWLTLLVAGFTRLFVYADTPGPKATAPLTLPADSRFNQKGTDGTLIIFSHPKCACTKATLGELARLMPHIKDKLSTLLVFVRPAGKDDAWIKDGLWQEARTIPGLKITIGEIADAEKFGAKTSGQVVLYDRNGQLVFEGGITPSRGHMGDSRGRESILEFVNSGKVSVATTRVFGCSLLRVESLAQTEGSL